MQPLDQASNTRAGRRESKDTDGPPLDASSCSDPAFARDTTHCADRTNSPPINDRAIHDNTLLMDSRILNERGESRKHRADTTLNSAVPSKKVKR